MLLAGFLSVLGLLLASGYNYLYGSFTTALDEAFLAFGFTTGVLLGVEALSFLVWAAHDVVIAVLGEFPRRLPREAFSVLFPPGI